MNIEYTLAEIAGMVNAAGPDRADTIRVTGVSTDTRTLQPGDIFFALSGDSHDGDRFVDAAFERGAAAAVSHTLHTSGPCILHPSPLEALQSLAATHRVRCNAQVIAITGSCGKTTAKEMVAAVLGTKYRVVKTPGNLNNDIGCPLSILGMAPQTHYAVIEMGANHPGEIARLCEMARPNESAVTIVAPAHLEGFGDIEGVARAKAEIMEALPADGRFYVNTDDPRCREMAERFSGEKVLFGKRGDVVLESMQFDEHGELVLSINPVGHIRLPLAVRAHSINVLLAVAVGLCHQVGQFEEPLRAACVSAIRFKVLRLFPWVILDDTYNANPASMAAALEALADFPGRRKIAVLGDMFELGRATETLHEEVGRAAAHHQIDWLLTLGEQAETMVAAARAAGIREGESYKNHQAVAGALLKRATEGDVILVKGSRGMKMETIINLLRTGQEQRK